MSRCVPLPCYLGMAIFAAADLAPSDLIGGLVVVAALGLSLWPVLARWLSTDLPRPSASPNEETPE